MSPERTHLDWLESEAAFILREVAGECAADLVWLAEQPLEPRSRYFLKHTTRTARARVSAVEHVMDLGELAPRNGRSALALNDIGIAAGMIR